MLGLFNCGLIGVGAVQQYAAHRRNVYNKRIVLAVARYLFGLVLVAGLVPLVNLRAQKFGIFALMRAEAVAVVRHGREVDYSNHAVIVRVAPLVNKYILQIVVRNKPFKALPVVIYLMHCGIVFVNAVERGHELFEIGVRGIIEHAPIEFLCEVPLVELSEFRAHKQQLFAGVREHVSKEVAHSRKLHVVISGHFIYKRTFAVDHFVVRNGQNKVFRKRVNHGERNGVVMVLTENGIDLDVRQRVVHPAHVPLKVEAQSAHIDGARNAAPCGGLLGNHERFGVLCEYSGIQAAQKVYRLQVFVSAVNVGTPFVSAVIEVEHARNRVHTQTVYVVHVHPIERVGNKEVAYFVAPVIETARSPLFVFHAQRVAVFVQRTAVEFVQSVAVFGEMPRHPVENNAYAASVHFIHKISKVLRRAVTRGRREVARYLIAPRPVERIFGDAHEFQVRIAEFFKIFAHFVGELTIIERIAVRVTSPRRDMRFVNAHRRGVLVWLVLYIVAVRPFKMFYVHDLGVGALKRFAVERERVAFIYRISKTVFDVKFIVVVKFDARHSGFPNSRLCNLGHAVGVYVPAVEVAYYGNRRSASGPNAEHGGAAVLVEMTPQILVGVIHIPVMISVKQFDVHLKSPSYRY